MRISASSSKRLIGLLYANQLIGDLVFHDVVATVSKVRSIQLQTWATSGKAALAVSMISLRGRRIAGRVVVHQLTPNV
jgi:hypothetical protein